MTVLLPPGTLVTPAGGSVIIVDQGGGGNYATIQEAVNAAIPGDTITVWAGYYAENVVIDKTITLTGNGTGNTTIDGGGVQSVLRVTADDVVISGFDLTKSGPGGTDAGITLWMVNRTLVNDCLLEGNSNGVYLFLADFNVIENSTFVNNSQGVNLYISQRNEVTGNNCTQNGDGIYSYHSDMNDIIGNNLSGNTKRGMFLQQPEDCAIENNTCDGNDMGIYMFQAGTNVIANNSMIGNTREGLKASFVDASLFDNNTMSGNEDGMHVLNSAGNVFLNSTVTGNTRYGVHMEDSTGQTFVNSTIPAGGFRLRGALLSHWNTHDIDGSNLVNGDPVYYRRNSDGDAPATAVGQVILANCTDSTVEGLWLSDVSMGVAAVYCANTTIRDVTCTDIGEYGIFIRNGSAVAIEGSRCDDSGSDGIRLESVHDSALRDNACGSNTWAGILLSGPAAGVNMTNNTCEGNTYGISLEGADNCTLERNTCGLNGEDGLRLAGANNNTLVNNTCQSNGRAGLTLEGGGNDVAGNIFDANDILGMSMAGVNAVTENSLSGNGLHGFVMNASGARGAVISGNAAEGNGGDGIHLSLSVHGIIANNTCRYNGRGISISDSDGDSLVGNDCTQNDEGIYIRSSVNTTLEDNTIHLNEMCGVNAGYSGPGMVMVNNSIQQNVAGVALLECTGVDIAINNLSYNAIGADLRYSHDNNITGNAIGDNDDGLLVTNSHGNTVTCNNISSSGRYGARVRWSDGNVLHHNNFQGNTIHAQDIGDNTWDDGSGSGNHWSGYTGSDDGSGGRDPGDGVGDDIVPYEGIDHYPYILPSGWLRPGFTAVQGPAGPDADGNFSLSWVPTLRTDRYVLEEDDDPGFLTPAAIYQGGEVNFSVTGRWEGEYYYRVRPESDTYTGMWSDAAHVTVSYLPPAPEILSVTPHAPGNALNVTWDVSGSGISRYRLDYATDGAGPWLRQGTFDHPGDTYDHTGLTDGARYHYRLQAINTLGQSGAFSEAVSGVPADSVAPAPPGGLHVTFPTIFALVVQWSASASEDVVAYNVYRSPNGTGGFVKVNDDPVTGLRYIDNGLEEGTEYHYTVTALDEVPNESSQPAPAAGTTLMDAHAPVADAAQDKVRIMEDSRDDEAINLLEWFSDANGDRLKFWAEGLKHLDVLIFPSDGTVVLTPEEDLNGEEKLTFVAWDGDFEARTDVVVNVTAVNDPPETPLIVDPINEISVWEDQGLLLYAMCDDPDLPYGDRLNFTWTVNSTAGEWYGDQVVEPPLPPGVHVITVTVTDTEGEASHAYVRVVIRSIPPEDVDDGGGVTQEGQRDMTWVFYLAVVSLAVIVLWVLLVHRWYGKKAAEHMDEAEKGPARKSRPGTKSPGPPSKGDAGAADPAADENDMPDQAAARMAGDEEPAQGEDEPPDGGDGLPDGGDGATDEDDEAPGAAWDGGEGPRSGGKLSLCGDDWDLDEEMQRSGECADDGAGTDGEVRP